MYQNCGPDKEVLAFITTCINLENTVLSEKNQAVITQIPNELTHMCNLKELISLELFVCKV